MVDLEVNPLKSVLVVSAGFREFDGEAKVGRIEVARTRPTIGSGCGNFTEVCVTGCTNPESRIIVGVKRFSGNFTGFLATVSLETPACELPPFAGEPVAIVNKVDPNWLNRAKELALEVV